MNKNIVLLLLAWVLLLQACNKDDTSEGGKAITTIDVVMGIEDNGFIDLNLNDSYKIVPEIKQSKDLPLSYEWEVDYKVVSTEKEYNFVGLLLGTYKVRLKVSNEDGSTFKEFTVRVNSQYEEGLMILGEATSGEGTLSFIPKNGNQLLSQTAITDVDINSFEKNNPGLTIGKLPSDIGIRGLQVFIASQEDGVSMVNYKTLELEGTIKAPEFADFKPTIMNLQDNASRSALMLTKSGKIYSLATLEFLMSNYRNADTIRLDQKSQFVPTINFTHNYFWDAKNSKFWNFWSYASNSGTELKGQNLIHFLVSGARCYVLTADKNNPAAIKKTVFGEYVTTFDRKEVDVLERNSFTNANMTLKADSKTLLDDFYLKLIYANGRDIYRWFYTTNTIPSAPYITLDIPGVITHMHKDPTNKEMYVGVYDADATGLKGSVVVYDLDTGAKKATFANIADKPIKLLFKIRK